MYTIAICTRNRSQLLVKTLELLISQVGEDPAVSIMVVDNDSSDSTKLVVNGFSNVLYMEEKQLGVTHARNHALEICNTPWLVFLDDDAFPTRDWWAEMRACIDDRELVADCILGRVDLEWEGGRAEWFPIRYESLLSAYDRGQQDIWVSKTDYLLTTNTAFRCELLRSIGGFRSDLGHKGKSLLGGEDNDVFNRLIDADALIRYASRATVNHWVPHERQTFRWLLKRVFWDGATQPLLDYGRDRSSSWYLYQTLRDIRRLVRLSLSVVLKENSNLILSLLLTSAQQVGRIWMNMNLAMRSAVRPNKSGDNR